MLSDFAYKKPNSYDGTGKRLYVTPGLGINEVRIAYVFE
jgi:hypothetical protein